MPRVSVLIPLYNGTAFIRRALESVQMQTFRDWEVLVINENGSDDDGTEIVREMAETDPRIRLIQNGTRLGLAESLNRGIREASGEYIARLDADDTALSERFEKQVSFLNAHPEVGLCGTWQLHYGDNGEWIHRAEPDPDKLRCMLLFWCDLCHSTLMLRKSAFLDNDLFYDPNALAEDFELWTRAMQHMQIVNLPEVLGTYNESTGITPGKKEQLNEESGRIAARTLERVLGLNLTEKETQLLNSWDNPVERSLTREEDLFLLQDVLKRIWWKNLEVHFFNSDYLIQILAAKWFWTKDFTDWKADYSDVHNLSQAFSDQYKPGFKTRYKTFREQNPQLKTRLKKIAKKIYRKTDSIYRKNLEDLKDIFKEIN